MSSKTKARAIRNDKGHVLFSIGVFASVAIVAATIASLPSPRSTSTTVPLQPPPMVKVRAPSARNSPGSCAYDTAMIASSCAVTAGVRNKARFVLRPVPHASIDC